MAWLHQGQLLDFWCPFAQGWWSSCLLGGLERGTERSDWVFRWLELGSLDPSILFWWQPEIQRKNQLRLVVEIPIIYKVWAPSKPVVGNRNSEASTVLFGKNAKVPLGQNGTTLFNLNLGFSQKPSSLNFATGILGIPGCVWYRGPDGNSSREELPLPRLEAACNKTHSDDRRNDVEV